MPESKKLSELISELINLKDIYESISNSDHKNLCWEKINNIRNQIDQKFEELRCECGKEEYPLPKDWEEMVTLYAVKDFAVNKIEERMNDEKKWSYYTQVMTDRFYAEYKKFERYMTTKEWIKIAVAKIISTLKEYDVNSKRDSKKSE